MVGNWNGNGCVIQNALHHDVAATLADHHESVRAMMAHISDPDRIRSLPNGHLNLRYYDLV